MSASKLLLTVAIPTYNRAVSLEKTLQLLKKENSELFEIIVSDNNSIDNTRSIVNKYKKSMPNLTYNRNDFNLGYSGNILRLYELTRTRYIWFLSDDEEVLPGAIDKIVDSLNKYKATVTLFNHIRIDPYNRKLVDGVKKDVIYASINDLKDYSPVLRSCFISIVVIEKNLNNKSVRRIYDKDNVYFQLSLVILLLNSKFKFCEIATPIVFRNTTYESGEFYKFIITDWLDAIFIVKSKFKRSLFIDWANKEIPNAFQLYLSQKIGMYKYNGRPKLKTVKKIIYYYRFSSLLIAFFPLLYYLVPTSLLRFLYKNKLKRIYNDSRAFKIYNLNLNRVYKNKINSGFVEYR